jgi:hypothetical protein
MINRFIIISFLVIIIVGCSPTDSRPKGDYISYKGSIINTDGDSTIIQFHVLYDGQRGHDVLYAEVSNWGRFDGIADGNVLQGHHTLVVTIDSQTVSPSRYRVFDVHCGLIKITGWDSGYEIDSLSLPEQTAILKTGGSISYSFNY